MWIALYQLAYAVALVLVGPLLLLRRGPHYRQALPGRLGGGAPGPPGERPLWLHAVSVGEAKVAATLARSLPAEVPLLVTTITPTGQEQAAKDFAGRAAVTYLPFDAGFALRRFFRRFRPRALVLIEGDHWPLLLRVARRRGMPVAVVNGRVGDGSYGRLRRFAFAARLLYGPVARFGVQTAADRDRLVALGVEPARIAVTGNLKFDSPEPAPVPALEAALARLAGGRPVLVAGSTMPGEEAAVAAAFQAAGGGERALLVVAPRHRERWGEAEAVLVGAGLATRRRSRLAEGDGELGRAEPEAHPEPRQAAAVLLDSYGELAGLYRIAAGAFVGGTIAPTGGHNPIEPARFGVPVAVGRSMENFREIAERFDDGEAWCRVADAAHLGRVWRAWLDDPEAAHALGARGAQLVESHRGALARTLELLAPFFAEVDFAEVAPEPPSGSQGER